MHSSKLPFSLEQSETGKKNFKERFRNFFCGFLLYAGSLGYQSVIILAIFYFCVWLAGRKTVQAYRGESLLTGILILSALSVVNNTLGIVTGEAQINSLQDYIPYLLLVASTVYFVRYINIETLHWFIILVLCEIVIAFFLKEAGINNIWGIEMTKGTLLYDQKVAGLSINSSGFGYKILNAVVIYEFIKHYAPDKKFLPRIIFYPLILLGLFLSFNRTTILCFSLFAALLCCVNYRQINIKIKLLIFLLCIIAGIIVLQNYETIMFELFRGDMDFEGNALSERPDVYAYYISFLMTHPFTGNFSFKLWSDIFQDGRLFHPHNSYLLTLVAHGFLISTVFFLLILRYFNKNNLLFLIPFLVAGILQSYIFWGLSVNDILFYYLLLFNFKAEQSTIEKNPTGEKCIP